MNPWLTLEQGSEHVQVHQATLRREIPGWVEALKLMKTGDTWELAIPSELGYGADGAGDTIPPNQTLVFTMSLVKVEYAP